MHECCVLNPKHLRPAHVLFVFCIHLFYLFIFFLQNLAQWTHIQICVLYAMQIAGYCNFLFRSRCQGSVVLYIVGIKGRSIKCLFSSLHQIKCHLYSLEFAV